MRLDRSIVVVVALACALVPLCGRVAFAQFSPVYNGSFEKPAADGVTPDGWTASGNKAIVQKLTQEKDPQRGSVAKLECTKFVAGMNDSQVMLAQTGHVGVEKDKWYRVSLWARSADLAAGAVTVQLVSFRTWWPHVISWTIAPENAWKQFQLDFMSKQDLKGADSRFSLYFSSTGTLWAGDVSIEPIEPPKPEWFPAIPMPAAGNALPNSDFECGGAGWCCAANEFFGYQATIFQLQGEWDRTQGFDGKASWKVTLSDAKPHMLYIDYPPLAKPVRSLQFSHLGWVRVEAGRPCVFSAYLKCSQPQTQVRIGLREAGGDWHLSASGGSPVGENWTRLQISYTPKGEYLDGYLGLDLPGKESQNAERTFWIDAVQLERGAVATPYHPRSAVEGAIATDAPGNIFTDPAKGLQFQLIAHNESGQPQTLQGRLVAADFWDRTAWQEDVQLPVAAGQTEVKPYAILPGRKGFFRLTWQPKDDPPQSLRCSVIDDYTEKDSVLGFNHTFAEDFMFPIAQEGGFRWWRDWTPTWDVVQPAKDAPFDFSKVDVQEDRVEKAGGNLLVVLPEPNAKWNKIGGKWPKTYMTNDVAAYGAYVGAAVKHLAKYTHVFEVINEPNYALEPPDYVTLLKTAYQAAKEADPQCTIMGGEAGAPAGPWLDGFIKNDGLRWCDLTNYHTYPSPEWAEWSEKAYADRWDQMNKLGEARPVWVTEIGIYAEDTPHTLPVTAGDDTMNEALRPTELRASQDMVQLATAMFAHGVRKLFFHMGLCSDPHSSGVGNVFFEYGGEPRKMYPAMSTLASLLGPDFKFVRKWTEPAGVCAYEFLAKGRTVVVLWTRQPNPAPLDVPQGLQALDLMGNPLPAPVTPGAVPIYLVGPAQ